MTRDEIIAAYDAGPSALEAALEGLGDAELDAAPGGGKWTIRQIIHHIGDSDSLTRTLITVALGNPGCTYDQRWYDTRNTFAETLDYAHRPVAPALDLIRATRRYVAELLRHFPDSLERQLTLLWEKQPTGQVITVDHLVRGQTWHLQHHVQQIRDIRSARGTG
jgi:hypothetical protein